MPTMITDATRTEIHVRRVDFSISVARLKPRAPPALPALLDQTPRFLGRQRVIIALTQRNRRLEFAPRGCAVALLDRDPAQLEVRAAVDPFSAFGRERALEIG